MLKLYGQYRSRAFRVCWLLKESNIPYEHVNVTINVPDATAKQDWYRALNPNARVPTIDDDGFVMWESAAINFYLAEKYKSPLLPPDMELAEQVDRIFYDELTLGKVNRESQRFMKSSLTDIAKQDVQAAVLACTELEMIVDVRANVLPIYDCTSKCGTGIFADPNCDPNKCESCPLESMKLTATLAADKTMTMSVFRPCPGNGSCAAPERLRE